MEVTPMPSEAERRVLAAVREMAAAATRLHEAGREDARHGTATSRDQLNLCAAHYHTTCHEVLDANAAHDAAPDDGAALVLAAALTYGRVANLVHGEAERLWALGGEATDDEWRRYGVLSAENMPACLAAKKELQAAARAYAATAGDDAGRGAAGAETEGGA
jgi:hypothetical protein